MQSVKTDLSCTFFPGKYSTGERVPELYNEVYRYWHRVWGEIFTAAGSPSSLNAENFLRQDVVIALHQENQIAGIITSSFFNLSADVIYDHAYIKSFPTSFVEKLRAAGVGLVITGEYLAVSPGFRKTATEAPLSDVLIGLLMKTFVQIEAKVALATTVRPARVHEICEKYGYGELGNFTKYGLDCILLSNSPEQLQAHSNPAVVALVETYWKSRHDFTAITIDRIQQAQAA